MPCKDIDDGKVEWVFTSDDYENGLVPDTYTFTYTVCVDGLPSVCETTTVTVTLDDPCDPPVQITNQALTD